VTILQIRIRKVRVSGNYVVSGGTRDMHDVVVNTKQRASEVAAARRRVVKKRAARRRRLRRQSFSDYAAEGFTGRR